MTSLTNTETAELLDAYVSAHRAVITEAVGDSSKFGDVSEAARRAGIAAVLKVERQRSQWQPIETAPKDGTSILVVGHREDGGLYYDVQRWPEGWSGHWPVFWMGYAGGDPTHWMPVPAAPVEA